MSSYTLADATLPHASAAVKVFSHLLDKAEQSTSPTPDALLATRLHETMLPLSFQFHFGLDLIVKLVARLEGVEPKDLGSFDSLKTVADARARIETAAAVVAAADTAKIASRTEEIVEYGRGPGKPPGQMKARDYAAGYSLPNIYFHITTAYNILRKEGIELGKGDFLGPFMSPYKQE